MRSIRKSQVQIFSGSMADIAFLLLIFFLVTTTIEEDAGLYIILPPHDEIRPEIPIRDRNLLTIHLNSEGEILIEKEMLDFPEVSDKVQRFLSNPEQLPHLSESPRKAMVSLKVSRKTSHKDYISLLDEIFAGYKIAQANSVNMSREAFYKLDPKLPEHSKLIRRASDLVPRRLSIADPY